MTDPDFIKEMQDSLRQQEEQQKLVNDEASHNASVREMQGPRKWQELKTLIMESADSINSGFPKPVLVYGEDGNNFFIRKDFNNEGAQIRFDPATGEISFEGSNGDGIFRPRVVGNELAYFGEIRSKAVTRRITFDDSLPAVEIPTMGETIIHCFVKPKQ